MPLLAGNLELPSQGEKGEPGMVIGADGSALSTLAGAPGQKGVKVMIVALLSLLSTSLTPFFPNSESDTSHFFHPVSVVRVTWALPDLLDLQWVTVVWATVESNWGELTACYKLFFPIQQGPVGPAGPKGELGLPGRAVSRDSAAVNVPPTHWGRHLVCVCVCL